jgi:hypothetical protein
MAHSEIDPARYLQKAGRECPFCLLEGVWHEHERISASDANDVRALFVPCWCIRCRATWVETYRLVGVSQSAQDAIATAEKTYRAGPVAH